MKKSCDEFRDWQNKSITLLGMSGVGKTTLSSVLPCENWFHYSGDYRIGTRYLNEPILDNVKKHAMENAFLREQLKTDSIYIRNNITVDHLQPIRTYMSMVGNPDLGGLSIDEFKYRQRLFKEAEINAMNDVGPFMQKAQDIYGYPHFINDAGGSICSFSDEECWTHLSARTMVIYIHADEDLEQTLIERAIQSPKPLFYDEAFLDTQLAEFIASNDLNGAEEINPPEFVQWVFPKLIAYRKPLYERIADQYGVTIDAKKIIDLRDETDFIDLICEAADN